MQIYSPSQIALAAIIHAASKAGQNLDSYVTDVLFATEDGSDNEHLGVIIEAVRSKSAELTVRNTTCKERPVIYTRGRVDT